MLEKAALAKLLKTGIMTINFILSSKEGPTRELLNTMHFWLLAHHQVFYLKQIKIKVQKRINNMASNIQYQNISTVRP